MLIERQKRLSRVRFRHPIRVVTLDGQPRVIRTLTANVSRKGLFLRMPEPLPLGTRVALSLEAGGRALALAQAEVVWGRANESQLPGRFPGCGVRFTEFMHPRASELVDYLVANLDQGKPLKAAPPERRWARWLPLAAAIALVSCGAAAAFIFSPSDPDPLSELGKAAPAPVVRASAIELAVPAPPPGATESDLAPSEAPAARPGEPLPLADRARDDGAGDQESFPAGAASPLEASAQPAQGAAAEPKNDEAAGGLQAAPPRVALEPSAPSASTDDGAAAARAAAEASAPIEAVAEAQLGTPAHAAAGAGAPVAQRAAAAAPKNDAPPRAATQSKQDVMGEAPSPEAGVSAPTARAAPTPPKQGTAGEPARAGASAAGGVQLPSGAAARLAWKTAGGVVTLTPRLAPRAGLARAFVLSDPPRAVFDLSGESPDKSHQVAVSAPHATSVRLGKLPTGTRVVVDLDRAPRQVTQDGASLLLTY